MVEFALALFGLLPPVVRLRILIRNTCLASALLILLIFSNAGGKSIKFDAVWIWDNLKNIKELLRPTMHWQNWGGTLKLQHQQCCRFSSGLDLSWSFNSLISSTHFLFSIAAGQTFFKFPTSPMQTVIRQLSLKRSFKQSFNTVLVILFDKTRKLKHVESL
jgi:hypothetical protein